MKGIKPISIDNIKERNMLEIPNIVILIINAILLDRWNGKEAIIKTQEILNNLQIVLNKTQKEIKDLHWLDIEPIYKKVGYNVEYVNYPQTNEPYFKFYAN